MMNIKTSVLLLAGALLFLQPAPVVRAGAADAVYAVAADTNVWFYSAEEEASKLFLIPETYYVRVLEREEEFSAVEYLVNDPPFRKVVGYCRTDALTFVDFVPERPYLRKEITLSYTLAAGGAPGGEFDSIERTFVYYGSRYEKGNLYLYVLSEGVFGYVPAEEEPAFERNDDFLAMAGPSEPAEEVQAGGLSAAEIVVICLASAAAVVCAVFVLRGKRADTGEPEL